MEKIDELRWLLKAHDHNAVTLTMLQGVIETTNDGDSYRKYEQSGDVAFVILGPKEKVNTKRVEHSDGSVVYTFTVVPPKP